MRAHDATPAAAGGPLGEDDRDLFGFWIYIMTDCVLFATIFAVFACLRENTMGGPPARSLFSPAYVLAETMLLLASSFTCGLAQLAARRGARGATLLGLVATGVLGLVFLGLELREFRLLCAEGHGWWANAYLSAFFTLVGTHGLHVAVGLFWLLLLVAQVGFRGLGAPLPRKLACFGLFWHFLDIVWIFVFSLVYLYGML